jgi:hypothetical protein
MIQLSVRTVDLIGALAAVLIYVGCIVVFLARLGAEPTVEHRVGLLLTLTVFPLTFLLLVAGEYARPPIYYVQLSLMIVFLLVELVLDYILEYEFRRIRWIVIPYVMLFFGGTGGMIGVAAKAGAAWAYSAVALFLAMGTLAFVQRAKTGM